MIDLLASPLGLVVGLVLGALGGGGSVLAIPALVYGTGQTFQAATTASLVIVGAVSVAGAWRHWRAEHVDLRGGLAFGAAGVAGAVVGTVLNHQLDAAALAVAFAGLMLLVAARMLRGRRRAAAAPAPSPAPAPSSVSDVATGADAHPALTCDADGPTCPPRAVRIVLAGTVVGVLTGLFGVGGGFVIVPALVLLLGYPMPLAIGTSLVVIAVNALAALAARGGALGGIDWSIVAPFTLMGLVGVWLGGRIADRVDAGRLTTAFAVLLLGLAVYTGWDGIVTMVA